MPKKSTPAKKKAGTIASVADGTSARAERLVKRGLRKFDQKPPKTAKKSKPVPPSYQYPEEVKLLCLEMFCRPMSVAKIGRVIRGVYPKLADRSIERWSQDGDWEAVRAARMEMTGKLSAGLINVDWTAVDQLMTLLDTAVDRANGKKGTSHDVFAVQKVVEQLLTLKKAIVAPLESMLVTEAQRKAAVDVALSAFLDVPAVAKVMGDEADTVAKRYADRLRLGGMRKPEADRLAAGLKTGIKEGVASTGAPSTLAAIAQNAARVKKIRAAGGDK